MAADFVGGVDLCFGDEALCVGDEIGGQMVENVAQGFVELEASASRGESAFGIFVEAIEKRHFAAQGVDVEKAGLECVVEVRGVVGDFVDPIDELRFERRTEVELIFGELRKFGGRIIAGMLDDAFANLEGEIQTFESGIAVLELFDDTQGLGVVIEMTTAGGHELIELFLSGVAKRGMADVVSEGKGFDEFGVEVESAGDGAGDLNDFESVGEAIAKVIGETSGEDLGFGFETAESAGMNDAIAITRVFGAIGMRGFRHAASAGSGRVHGPRGQRGRGKIGNDRDLRFARNGCGLRTWWRWIAGRGRLRRRPWNSDSLF